MDNLFGAPLFAQHYLRQFGYGNEEMIVLSPDVGSVARAGGERGYGGEDG